MFIGIAMGGTFLLVVIFMVSVLGYSELRAALALTVMPLVALVIAPNSGRLVDRIGPRIPAVVGAAFFAVGLVLLAQLNGSATLPQIMWRIAFIGAGMGFAMPTLSAASMASLPPAGARRRLGLAEHAAPGGLHPGRGRARGDLLAHRGDQRPGGDHPGRRLRHGAAADPGRKLRPTSPPISRRAPRRRPSRAAARPPRTCAANLLGDAPPAAAGSPAAQIEEQVAVHIVAIYKDDIAKSFTWPFYAAALAALLAIVPGALTGRRLGEHEGHEKMNRAQRAQAVEGGASDTAADATAARSTTSRDPASSTTAGTPADAVE